ncbi:MAG: 30S ribosomal protein S13, partial [Chlamydiae bacterium]|nr:30S ribosomal protein S13 [Chlamydiota bacterium]
PDKKRTVISLTYIYGVGLHTAKKILAETGINPDRRAFELSEADISKLAQHIQTNYPVEGDLRREVQNNIKRLISIKSYRGDRHRKGLPVRGQRTRTNARTRKGKPKTVQTKKKTT